VTAPSGPVEVRYEYPEKVLAGDVLDEGVTVQSVTNPPAGDYVYAFTPEQVPLRRGRLVAVYRRAGTDLAAQVDALRTITLALADSAPAATKTKIAPAVDRVKGSTP
jgi:hypothetical protein